MKVPFSYLSEQFKKPEPLLKRIGAVVKRGDFTLGKEVGQFEELFAKHIGTKYAVGVNSGTDALFLSLKALGIGAGDEVITMTNTFIATAGAIAATGAKPVYVDCTDEYLIDLEKVEAAITPATKAIMPVHYAGHPVDMPAVLKLAKKHNLQVVEDACQAIDADIKGKKAGSFGITGAFSLHPLKNINVWADAGVIVTSSKAMYEKLRLLRNHGMKNRDEYSMFGYNSRLDTIQAALGLYMLGELPWITKTRAQNAAVYDKGLRGIPGVHVPERRRGASYVFHLYIIQVERRDELKAFLEKRGIEAKVHYPIPLHLQECSAYLGYKLGDFPVAERHAKTILTLPAHQHLSKAQLEFVVKSIKEFYGKK